MEVSEVMKHIKPISTLILGFLAVIAISNYTPAKPYIGDLSKTPDMLSLGEDIYEGFPVYSGITEEYECFLRAVYNEAYSEGVKGQQAVAQILYNRYVSGKFPDNMCSIIGQRVGRVYQFPWMQYSNKRNLVLEDNVIEEMSQYLDSIYLGMYTVPKLERATYFKRCDVKGDSWWNTLKMVAKIGDHCFYQKRGA
jgi:spore germination cell wall hydrolase CwlJ-like protein